MPYFTLDAGIIVLYNTLCVFTVDADITIQNEVIFRLLLTDRVLLFAVII